MCYRTGKYTVCIFQLGKSTGWGSEGVNVVVVGRFFLSPYSANLRSRADSLRSINVTRVSLTLKD